jgi:hypothetical protein
LTGVGRPGKLTKKCAAKIIELVRKGNFYSTAARASGLHPNTINEWIKRGNAEGEGKYYKFMVALEEADAQAEIDAVARWAKHQDNSPEATKEYLRRRHPHWNVPDKREVKAEITEDKDVIDARVDEYFTEAKRRGIVLRDGAEESVYTSDPDAEAGNTPKE